MTDFYVRTSGYNGSRGWRTPEGGAQETDWKAELTPWEAGRRLSFCLGFEEFDWGNLGNGLERNLTFRAGLWIVQRRKLNGRASRACLRPTKTSATVAFQPRVQREQGFELGIGRGRQSRRTFSRHQPIRAATERHGVKACNVGRQDILPDLVCGQCTPLELQCIGGNADRRKACNAACDSQAPAYLLCILFRSVALTLDPSPEASLPDRIGRRAFAATTPQPVEIHTERRGVDLLPTGIDVAVAGLVRPIGWFAPAVSECRGLGGLESSGTARGVKSVGLFWVGRVGPSCNRAFCLSDLLTPRRRRGVRCCHA